MRTAKEGGQEPNGQDSEAGVSPLSAQEATPVLCQGVIRAIIHTRIEVLSKQLRVSPGGKQTQLYFFFYQNPIKDTSAETSMAVKPTQTVFNLLKNGK